MSDGGSSRGIAAMFRRVRHMLALLLPPGRLGDRTGSQPGRQSGVRVTHQRGDYERVRKVVQNIGMGCVSLRSPRCSVLLVCAGIG